MSEMVEVLISIIYMVIFTFAFYGINAKMIGGVRFSGCHYKEVKDIGVYLSEAGMMLLVDFTCLVTSGNLLWKIASINLLEKAYRLLQMYWSLISIQRANSMFGVSLFQLVSSLSENRSSYFPYYT